MDIANLISSLGELKKAQAEAYKTYKGMKEAEDSLKAQLIEQLQVVGLKSAKGDKYSVSISSRSDVVVTHEQSVIEWLKTSPDVETDAYIGLKMTPFKVLAKQVLKDTGEIVPGTNLKTIESISVKENK